METPAMKISARIMLGMINFSLVAVLALMLALGGKSAQAKDKTKKVASPERKMDFTPKECMGRKPETEKCKMMLALLKNLEDSKKASR